jgi:hypothetical protein
MELNVQCRFLNIHQASLTSAKFTQSSFQSIPTISLRLVLILSLRLNIPRCLIRSVFPTKLCMQFRFPQLCYMHHIPHPPWFHRPSMRSMWLRFLIMHATSSSFFLRPPSKVQIILHPQTALICFLPLKPAGHQVSHPYQTTGWIIVLEISIFLCTERWEDKTFWTEM